MASTIKVDNVQNQPGTNIVSKCGTDVTLGASGDTVALACGASQTGFGRTGTVDWITTPKVTGDSPVTGVSGNGYFLNTTAGEITINLPAGSAGDIISMADYAATWQTNKVTVVANGSEKIGGVDQDATLTTEGQSVTFVYVDGTQGWINTMDSTSNVRGAYLFVTATGGTPCSGAIVCTNYKTHTFTGPGTFTVTCAGSAGGSNTVDYLVVAGGGGGGGGGDAGGGAGAGGYRYTAGTASGCYCAGPAPLAAAALPVSATPYPIAVGGGGALSPGSPTPDSRGTTGSDATFSTITSTGGGGGGGSPASVTPTYSSGRPGGSGGGAATTGICSGCVGAGNTPSVSPPQGFDGGTGASDNATYRVGGGGGGGGAVGASTSNPAPAGGAGGNGLTNTITATPVARGGGGGGGGHPTGSRAGGSGGTGGGGDGAFPGAATAGGCNTGGGGGGGIGGVSSGAGGSGVVIIRYKFQ